jgi:hypothetical protein
VKTIETFTDVNARPEVVWDVITDFTAYGEWNPFITEISGELREGARLRAKFSIAGRKPRTFTPTVRVVDPGRRLAWRGRLAIPRCFDAEHVLAVEPAATGCRFVHREGFTGVLVPFLRSTLAATHDAFVAMDRALAQRAEAIAGARPGD